MSSVYFKYLHAGRTFLFFFFLTLAKPPLFFEGKWRLGKLLKFALHSPKSQEARLALFQYEATNGPEKNLAMIWEEQNDTNVTYLDKINFLLYFGLQI